ncbi:hypothetical protein J1J09_005014, partial [Salmonella enterica subsp. enterica serovar 4,[5],12:b:-]|nr:hypothetical protein [Salmonella enterica subsp. enterica serovar 4,[5],12:b:-]
GSALHQSLQWAFNNSRDEFCERQCLTLFWYFGHCLFSLDLKRNFYLKEEILHRFPFVSSLFITGDIFLFDISYFSPVRIIVCIYLSDSGKVRFSAGAAGNQDIHMAIQKSILEMYQAYVLMVNLTDERLHNPIIIDDPIMVGYLKHNCQITVDKFRDMYLHYRTIDEAIQYNIGFRKEFSSEPIFLYKKQINYSKKSC